MSDMITGGCICGLTRYEANQQPGFMFLCQCSDCQRITGTGHAALLLVQRADLKLEGPVKEHSRKLENGNEATHIFCAECGNPILNQTSGHTDIAFLHAGSLDDPSLFNPQKAMFRDSGQSWDLHDPEA